MSDTAPLEAAHRLVAEADRVRASGALGRSGLLGRLFDFLLDRSMAGQTPKEVEVAQEVFGKGADFDMMQDASVRVYIHRLRRKLEEHYAARPPEGDRLFIPRGEYRLAVAEAASLDPEALAVEPVEPAVLRDETRRWRRRGAWIAIAAALLAVNAGGWWYYADRTAGDPAYAAVAETKLWAPLAASNRPTFIVLGDYYIFGEANDGIEVNRLVREFAINSRADLDEYLMLHPDRVGRYVDVDLHYLPISTGTALRTLLPLVNGAATGGVGRPRIITMSELTPDILKSSNIVYIGYLSGLGLLRDALFGASNLAIGSSYDELIDEHTGKRFIADWSAVADGRSPKVDYGYLAGLSGPTGNRIIVISGTRDAALMQAAESAADPAQIARITAKAGQGDGFEALYEVQTLANVNFGSRLEVAYPLRARDVWRAASQPSLTFPDELPAHR